MKYFGNLQKIMETYTSCVFCKNPLQHTIYSSKIDFNVSDLNIDISGDLTSSSFDGEKFILDLLVNYYGKSIIYRIYLSTKQNTIKFKLKSKKEEVDALPKPEELITCFESLFLNLQLYCNHEDCGMIYYLVAGDLTVRNLIFNYNKLSNISLDPIGLYEESCHVDNYWISNDLLFNRTKIYSLLPNSVGKSSIFSLEPSLNFASLGKELLVDRVRTIVTFL